MQEPPIEITGKQALALIRLREHGDWTMAPRSYPELLVELAELVELGLVDTQSQRGRVLTRDGIEALSAWERGDPVASKSVRRQVISEGNTVIGAAVRLRSAFFYLFAAIGETWPWSKFRRSKS